MAVLFDPSLKNNVTIMSACDRQHLTESQVTVQPEPGLFTVCKNSVTVTTIM